MLRLEHACLTLSVLAVACNELEEFGVEVEPIDFGVEVRLDAVTHDYRGERCYAIGSGGLVVDDLGTRWDLPGSLRDVIDVEGGHVAGLETAAPRLIVVGDDGFVATALHPEGAAIEFEIEAVGTTADLWAVAAARDQQLRIVVVGDDALIVGSEDPQGELVWTQPPAPAGGWGRLRDVDLEHGCAIGEAGRMVCAHGEDLFDGWELVALATDADLNSFCSFYSNYVVGDAGTLIITDPGSPWAAHFVQPVDLFACTRLFVNPVFVGGDRTIYGTDYDGGIEPLLELDWQPRAVDPQLGTLLVGDAGRAGRLVPTGFVLQ